MTDLITLRRATAADAVPLVPLIHRVLEVSNTPDYGAANVARVQSHFTVDGVAGMIAACAVWVAVRADVLVGTASLGARSSDGTIVLRTFFVDPDIQRQGVGSKLLAVIEDHARELDLAQLPVRSSIAGEPFYASHGYIAVEDHWDGDERTIQMVKSLI